MGNVANARQVPLPAQRSDDWILEETPTAFPGSGLKAESRRIGGLLKKELELADTERLLLEAEATLERLKGKYAADKEAWEKRKASELAKPQDPRNPPK